MGCNDCQSPSLQGTQYCQECMPDESSVIIPDTIVPDPFLMDRNHIYLLPNGESYILNYDRTQAIKLGGSGGGSSVDISSLEDKIKKAQYDDTELRNKVDELSNKEDKDTIYNDTEIKAKLKELEEKLDKKEDIPVKYHYVETDISSNRYLDLSGFGEKAKYFSTLKDTFDFSIDTLIVKLYLDDIITYDYHTVEDLQEDTSIEYEDSEAERLAREPDEEKKHYSTGNEFIIADSGERVITIPFLIPNGDIIHFKAKVIANDGYITFSEVTSYLEMATTTKYGNSGRFDIYAFTSNSVRIKGKDFVTTNNIPLKIKVIRKRLERES